MKGESAAKRSQLIFAPPESAVSWFLSTGSTRCACAIWVCERHYLRAPASASKELSILVGRHPRRSSATWGVPLIRAAISVVLMLAALTPFSVGFLVPVLATESNCSMECCRRAKSCCCRQKSKSAQHGKHFTAPPECPSGCNQSAAVSGAVALAVPPQSARSESLAPERHILSFALFSRQSPQTAFALFGRPPPFSLRLITNPFA